MRKAYRLKHSSHSCIQWATAGSEPSADDKQKLIEKVADICWNHRVNPDIETFEEWLNLIRDGLKER